MLWLNLVATSAFVIFSTPRPTTRLGATLTKKKVPSKWGSPTFERSLGGWTNYTARGAPRTLKRLSHVLVATEATALEMKRLIEEGEATFESFVPFSLCEASKDRGGSLGWDPAPLLDGHSVTIDKGSLEILTTSRGVHLIRCDETSRRREVKRRFNLTYDLETMGCQMNVADSERISGALESIGLQKKGHTEDPDVVIVNTCSIRDKAEQKVYSFLGPHAARKRKTGKPVIAVAGCVAQQEGERLLRRVPEIDAVVGPQFANSFDDVLERILDAGEQVVATEAVVIDEDRTKPQRQSTVCAWVNVVYGCNERCTYCVVPATRGIEQSRSPDAILNELKQLKAVGFKEATLLGQNVDAYGRDIGESFHDLLRKAALLLEKDFRLRFVTSHPRYMSDRVVDVVAEFPDVLMPVFHIPAQSGDDKVLALMGRGYTRDRYLRIIDRIRTKLPDATITSDFIVGCPGETEEAYERTLSLMREVEFDASMTAAYSPRPGTPMARWDGASDAFATLLDDHSKVPVDLLRSATRKRRREHDDDDLTTLSRVVETAFKAKAKTMKTDPCLGDLVHARDVAREALQRAKDDPLFVFDPLAQIGPAQLDDATKERRLHFINDLQKNLAYRRSQRFLGRVEEVLVEAVNPKRPGQLCGRTRNNKLVFFPSTENNLIGTFVPVKITNATAFSLSGELH